MWSVLEYACHVRDVLLIQRDRAVLARVEDRPSVARMYRDERVALCRYGDQALDEVLAQVEDRPSVARMYRDERVALCRYADQALDEVLAQLAMAAELCALVFGRLDDGAWSRRLVYNWPAAAERDLAWLGRHTVHEVEHHLRDVVAVLSRVTTASAP